MPHRFYHVSRLGHLEGEIVLSRDLSRYVIFKDSKYLQNEEVFSTLERDFPNGFSKHADAYFAEKLHYEWDDENRRGLVHYESMIEVIFELVRQLRFPAMPSRLQSFYASETLEEARTFRSSHPDQAPNSHIYLVETNAFVRLDMSLLILPFHNASSITAAEKYWSGGASKEPRWEYLLELPVKVIERIE